MSDSTDKGQELTKRFIDSIPLSKDGVITYYWDSKISGFGFYVGKTCKTFVIQYRKGAGGRTARKVIKTIGRYGKLTLEEARNKAKVLFADIIHGDDPAEKIRRERANPVFEIIAEEYLEKYANVYKKPSSVRTDKSILEHDLKPALGKTRIMEITKEDVREIHTAITKRGSPIKANRTVKLLSKIMNLCEEWGYRQRDTNPCKWVAHNPENERDRYLDCHENSFSKSIGKSDKEKESELTIFLKTITEAVADGTIHMNYGRIYLLLLLTGARLTEITHLQKKEIDFNKSRIVKADHKTLTTQRKKKKLRIIMLNDPAIEIIKETLAETDKDFEYVFESHANPGFPYVNISKGWKRLLKKAGITDFHMHDLRHTHASILYNQDYSLRIIGNLLGQTQESSTMRYSHIFHNPLQEASEVVGNEISKRLNIQKPVPVEVDDTNIVKFPQKRR